MFSNDQKSAIQEAQLKQLLTVNVKTLITNIFLACLATYMQKDILSSTVSIAWLSAFVCIALIRMAIGYHYLRIFSEGADSIAKRLNIFRLGLIATSILWGIDGLLVAGQENFEQQLFFIYILVGVSSGAAVVYSIDSISALALVFFAVIPTMIVFALAGDPIIVAMSVAGFAYVLFMVSSIRGFNATLKEGILLRLEAVEQAEKIKQLAFYDVLTNLPNRRLLLDRLKQALILSRRTGKRGAILFLDLDHFKNINDTLGHSVGDLLLKQVAERLKNNVRESDTVARLGGDEFVVMLENLNEEYALALDELNQVASKLLASLNNPYELEGTDYISTPSIGVAIFGEHGATDEELLKHADIAMYEAKKAGRNRVCIYGEGDPPS